MQILPRINLMQNSNFFQLEMNLLMQLISIQILYRKVYKREKMFTLILYQLALTYMYPYIWMYICLKVLMRYIIAFA